MPDATIPDHSGPVKTRHHEAIAIAKLVGAALVVLMGYVGAGVQSYRASAAKTQTTKDYSEAGFQSLAHRVEVLEKDMRVAQEALARRQQADVQAAADTRRARAARRPLPPPPPPPPVVKVRPAPPPLPKNLDEAYAQVYKGTSPAPAPARDGP